MGRVPARDNSALDQCRGQSAYTSTPLAAAFGYNMPTFLRARNASDVERRALALPPRASALGPLA
jgi:hypothetical protein